MSLILDYFKPKKIEYNKTELYYDKEMLKHKNPKTHHVECPERISETYKVLNDLGINDMCQSCNVRKATEDELKCTHSDEHIRKILSVNGDGSFDYG